MPVQFGAQLRRPPRLRLGKLLRQAADLLVKLWARQGALWFCHACLPSWFRSDVCQEPGHRPLPLVAFGGVRGPAAGLAAGAEGTNRFHVNIDRFTVEASQISELLDRGE